MTEEEFKKAFYLIKQFSLSELLQAKNSLFIIIQEMELEKKNISNEVRRAVYYFQVSNKVKAKRIKYIDEIIVPRQNEHLESQVNEVFPELKTTSLRRLRSFRKERERLMKVTSDHSLKVKQIARLLTSAYAEQEKVQKQYESINHAELVRYFFIREKVSPELVIEDELRRYFVKFNGGGN